MGARTIRSEASSIPVCMVVVCQLFRCLLASSDLAHAMSGCMLFIASYPVGQWFFILHDVMAI